VSGCRLDRASRGAGCRASRGRHVRRQSDAGTRALGAARRDRRLVGGARLGRPRRLDGRDLDWGSLRRSRSLDRDRQLSRGLSLRHARKRWRGSAVARWQDRADGACCFFQQTGGRRRGADGQGDQNDSSNRSGSAAPGRLRCMHCVLDSTSSHLCACRASSRPLHIPRIWTHNQAEPKNRAAAHSLQSRQALKTTARLSATLGSN